MELYWKKKNKKQKKKEKSETGLASVKI